MSYTRPLLGITISFLAGIALAGVVDLPVDIWLTFAAITLAIGLLWGFLVRSAELTSLARDVTFATIFAVFLLLGCARYQSAKPHFDAFDLAWYNDRDYDVLITGYVTELPDERDSYVNLRVRVIALDNGGGTDLPINKKNNLLLARVDPDVTYHYGDVIRLRGKLLTPPENEDFSYRDYLAREGIHSTMTSAEITVLPQKAGNAFSSAMFALKERALNTIYKIFPDPEASLLAGILLGMDNGLPSDLQQAFKDTGTSHIIAISGFNIAIIASIFLSLFGRLLGQRRGAFAAALGIAFYTLLVGADAAVVRAAVMGSIALFARHLGRQQDGLNTLFFVAALMALFNPLYLSDVGFQLSFFATLGLILYASPLSEFVKLQLTKYAIRNDLYINTERTSSIISDFFLLTLAAQVTTLPIMAYHFNRLSIVSFIANPFILPAQPAVMILGGLADILGMIFIPLGQLLAFITWPFVTYTIHLVDFFASLPFAAISVDFPLWAVFAWFAALLTLTVGGPGLKDFYMTLQSRFPKIPAWAALSALTLLAMLIWRAALSLPDGRLHVTFLDAGSSDAILIQTPSGGTVLINGGESLSQLSSQLGQRLSLFDRELDWLIVASTQENQVAALPRLMERYPPREVLWSGNEQASFPSRALDKWLADNSVRVTRAEADQVLDLGDGATLTMLTSGPRGAVLLLEYQGFRMLLPIGADFDTLAELQARDLGEINVLLLADSGFAQLNPVDWINSLNPQLVVLSVGAGDFRGMPDIETMDAVAERALVRTDFNGWIQIITDGTQVWIEVERGNTAPTATPTEPPTEEPAATEPPATEAPLETQAPFETAPPVDFTPPP